MNKLKDPYAGLTSQAAVEAVGNRYDLILIGARRVRELNRGDAAKISPRYGSLVTAQVEIEQGLVGRDYLKKDINVAPRRHRDK
jgi:DNA-directed RNA polymerase omega subunit